MKEIILFTGEIALVDDCDFEWLNKRKWHLSANGYAVSTYTKEGQVGTVRMHRLILNPPDGTYTDHINQNKLDNRRCNLRNCTKSQNGINRKLNMNNTSGIMGVVWDKFRNKWRAEIMIDYKHIYLGRFVRKEDAARAYDRKAKELFGEFARTNGD